MNVRHIALISALALGATSTLDAREQWSRIGAAPAYREGHERGVRAGLEDSRRNQAYEFRDEADFRRADAGYRREYGPIDRFRDEFRRGYEAGYREGYVRYSNDGRGNQPAWFVGRGGPGGYDAPGRYGGPGYGTGRYGAPAGRYDLAIANGYRDGYDEGRNDGRGRRRFAPTAESRYRNADRGYERSYGTRALYETRYREGFLEGYRDGYYNY